MTQKRRGRAFYTGQGGLPWRPGIDHPCPWQQRSTVNESPWWGLRTGRAVDSQRRRFSNAMFPALRRVFGRRRLIRLIGDRGYYNCFYPGRYSRWD